MILVVDCYIEFIDIYIVIAIEFDITIVIYANVLV